VHALGGLIGHLGLKLYRDINDQLVVKQLHGTAVITIKELCRTP
jgi:hypothetical protein